MKSVRSEFGKCVDKSTNEFLSFVIVINGRSKVYQVEDIKMTKKEFDKKFTIKISNIDKYSISYWTEERIEKQRLENLDLEGFKKKLDGCKSDKEVIDLFEMELFTAPKYNI